MSISNITGQYVRPPDIPLFGLPLDNKHTTVIMIIRGFNIFLSAISIILYAISHDQLPLIKDIHFDGSGCGQPITVQSDSTENCTTTTSCPVISCNTSSLQSDVRILFGVFMVVLIIQMILTMVTINREPTLLIEMFLNICLSTILMSRHFIFDMYIDKSYRSFSDNITFVRTFTILTLCVYGSSYIIEMYYKYRQKKMKNNCVRFVEFYGFMSFIAIVSACLWIKYESFFGVFLKYNTDVIKADKVVTNINTIFAIISILVMMKGRKDKPVRVYNFGDTKYIYTDNSQVS